MRKSHPKAYARALHELTQGKRGAELNKILERFVAHLAKTRMLKQSDRIINEFIHYAKAQEGTAEIEIHSARELTTATINQVKSALGGGDKVEAAVSVDSTLLGGVVVRAKDRILDGSLKTQLNLLKIKLSS